MKVSTRSPGRRGGAGIPPAPTREEAEALAGRLAAEWNGRNDEVRSVTFGAYLTKTWLPGKGSPSPSRPGTGTAARSTGTSSPPSPISGYEGSKFTTWRPCTNGCSIPPTDGDRWRRNVALVAHAPKLKSIPNTEPQAWNAQQLQAFPQAAAGHRLFPAFWLNKGVTTA